ncbi:hypothetical protein [Streptomyces sp. NPDC052107]|uniref:hypothetical protein n=1 Tax=Streptomyces sp. NPDC052107 TaxID=3155632 RepID=UPI0034293915
MTARLYGGLQCRLPRRENTISRFRVPGNGWAGTLEIQLRLTIVVVIVLIGAPVCGAGDGRLWVAAGLMARLSVRALILRI